VLAALCSFFIPGLGQLLQGRLFMAILQFCLAAILWFVLLGWVIHLWSILDAAPRMALFFADYSLGLLGLRDGSRKFIYELDSGRSRLFDVETDPLEKRDLSLDEAARARWYAQNLRNWSAAQKSRVERRATRE